MYSVSLVHYNVFSLWGDYNYYTSIFKVAANAKEFFVVSFIFQNTSCSKVYINSRRKVNTDI